MQKPIAPSGPKPRGGRPTRAAEFRNGKETTGESVTIPIAELRKICEALRIKSLTSPEAASALEEAAGLLPLSTPGKLAKKLRAKCAASSADDAETVPDVDIDNDSKGSDGAFQNVSSNATEVAGGQIDSAEHHAVEKHTIMDSEDIRLYAWFHPSMDLPKSLDLNALEFIMPRAATIDKLMEACEDKFFEMAENIGANIELSISVLWNTKNHKQALNPADVVAMHLLPDDTFGVYGEIMPLINSPSVITENSKIPSIVLTGFLGAGKTTLLNYILKEQKEKKIAVIENEFGDIPVDDALLKQDRIALPEKIVTLDNGCVCCTVRKDLECGLKSVLEANKTTGGIDALIIETTGLADPVPIVRTIRSIPDVMAHFFLDGIIAVADAKHLPHRLKDQAEVGKVNVAYQQVAFADRVLLNKIDLVTPEDVVQLHQHIRIINRLAKMIPSVRGQVNLADILGLNAHSLMHFGDDDFERDGDSMPPPMRRPKKGSMKILSENFGAASAKGKSRHSSKVASFSIVQEGEISKDVLCGYLQNLQSPPPSKGQVFRFKPILAVRGFSRKIAVHAVHDVVDQDFIGIWQDGEPRICKMVFIGKDLDEKYFRDMFKIVTNF